MNDKLNEWFLGNAGAVHFVECMWGVAQDWDDMWDEANIDTEKVDNLIVWLAFGKEEHPFFKEHSAFLRPIMCSVWLQWQAANALEADHPSESDIQKSFVLRAGIYGLIHAIAWIIGGSDHARNVGADIYRNYGERLEDVVAEILEGEDG